MTLLPTQRWDEAPNRVLQMNVDWVRFVSGLISQMHLSDDYWATDDENLLFDLRNQARELDDSFREGSILPIWGVYAYVGAISEIPAGHVFCLGQTLLRIDYPTAYARAHPSLIVDADTFIVPNLRDRFLYGASTIPNYMTQGGEAEHTLTVAEMPSHSHGYVRASPTLITVGAGAPTTVGGLPPATPQTTAEGGDQPHNNLPPFWRVGWAVVLE